MHGDHVRVERPCPAEWASMTRQEAARRFCGACKKHVHDLAAMTENQARALLASPRTDGLCVRVFTDARGELLFRPDVPVSRLFRSSSSKAALRAMAVVAPLALGGCVTTGEALRPPPGLVAPAPTPTPTTPAPTASSSSASGAPTSPFATPPR